MTGPEHFREAEKHIQHAADHGTTAPDHERAHLAYAQVHATLALAAATALGAHPDGLAQAERAAWRAVAGTPTDRDLRAVGE